MRDFRGMKVWAKAHALTLAVYRASAALPGSEAFGLTAQVRRSSSSIASNIAEGCGRRTGRDMARFVAIARGSASELEYRLLLWRDLGYRTGLPYEELAAGVIEVKKMLAALLARMVGDVRARPPASNEEWKPSVGR
jgi:four helix bundle protein